jgi:hypothetical protein
MIFKYFTVFRYLQVSHQIGYRFVLEKFNSLSLF